MYNLPNELRHCNPTKIASRELKQYQWKCKLARIEDKGEINVWNLNVLNTIYKPRRTARLQPLCSNLSNSNPRLDLTHSPLKRSYLYCGTNMNCLRTDLADFVRQFASILGLLFLNIVTFKHFSTFFQGSVRKKSVLVTCRPSESVSTSRKSN